MFPKPQETRRAHIEWTVPPGGGAEAGDHLTATMQGPWSQMDPRSEGTTTLNKDPTRDWPTGGPPSRGRGQPTCGAATSGRSPKPISRCPTRRGNSSTATGKKLIKLKRQQLVPY